ncbi:YadA C-terminal domain-containing protein [Synechococcus sp. UW140]|uniref:YadA C-terminal domain-containing protein n=1 Tax=Synechococcus sp. UW140 TaxID=368503 RepID=UPI000E0EB7DD|nr:YadA C-terminal domain-containing protein [Synechococcus sp. UW140]
MNFAKRLFLGLASCTALSIISTPGSAQEWTDILYWINDGDGEDQSWVFYDFNENTGKKKLFSRKKFGKSNSLYKGYSFFNEQNGNLSVTREDGRIFEFNRESSKWVRKGRNSKVDQFYKGGSAITFLPIPGIRSNLDGTVDVGIGQRTITLDGEGVSSKGTNLISNKNDVIHIGENSLITHEEDGIQKLYAQDAEGNPIPINITEGTDLQINGVSVQSQIETNQQDIKTNAAEIRSNRRAINAIEDNVNDLGFGVAGATALSTAMTALPTVAEDSPLSCGVGTGGYSSRYAMSVGCAVKATERLSFNAGGSYVFGGAADYGNGSLSNVAGRAGFVFKLGEVKSSSKGDLQARVTDLEKANQTILEANQTILEENASIKSINNDLMARLERLEAIASSSHTDRDLASR